MTTPSRHKTAGEFAYDELTRAISTGKLKPGEHLGEKELSAWLNVSRTPVREALSRIANDGLIEVIPHRGAVVKAMDPADIWEEYVVRAALESLAVELSVPHVPDDVLADLTDETEQMHEALRNDKLHQFLDMNRDLHLRLYSYCDSPRLLGMIESAWDKENFLRRYYYSRDASRSDEEHMHNELLECYRTRDARRAAELVRNSLLETGISLAERLREQNTGQQS